MTPLTPAQQKTVLAHVPAVRKMVAEMFPADNFRREDAESDGFLALCFAIQSFRGQPDEFAHYLRACVRNAIRRSGRREAKHTHETYPEDTLPSRDPGPVEKSIEQEAKEIIARKAAEMSFDDRITIAMKFLDFSAEDIAGELRKPVRTVRHRLQKSRERFENLFSEKS